MNAGSGGASERGREQQTRSEPKESGWKGQKERRNDDVKEGLAK